jgi:phosphocarrier protein FPr
MVGLVVVSHSRALARAAVALAGEMVQGREVPVEVAAGLDDDTSGTDAVQIADAVQRADRGDGVVVLMDLGSAVLSAELALEMLDEPARDRVVLCPAPLVEGLVAAAVVAAAGAGRDEVAGEAAAALDGKRSQLTPRPGVADGPGGTAGATDAAVFTVTNAHGLHARPAARLVAGVRAFDARVDVRNVSTGSAWVPASSLSRVATLGARHGHEIEVRAAGAQRREVLDHLLALAARGFDEPASAYAEPGPARAGATGVPAAAGIGIGPAWSMRSAPVEIPDRPPAGASAEWSRLEEAVAVVRRDLQRARDRTVDALFAAHLLLLDDADLLDEVRRRIGAGAAAAPAWAAAVTRVEGEFTALADPYLAARAADVRAVGDQVLRTLLGVDAAVPSGTGVLVAADLTPAEAAELDPDRVAGVLLAFGSPTSHSAVLARTRGIPAVVGLGSAILDVPDGTTVALDGSTGEVVVDPAPPVLDAFRARAAERSRRRQRAVSRASLAAATSDGTPVLVGANVGSLDDARAAADSGADLAGLVRTEFLFLGRTSPPGVDEQEAVYRQVAVALGGRRITLRTLDAGGDKPLAYLRTAPEANPFLGVRGIRLSLANPALLADQLLAIVRVARDMPVSVMFPMVGTVDEVRRARRLLDDAVKLAGRGEPAGLHVGIMVEVPATALKAAAFRPYVDFFSLGTNDLTQYALAAERGNPAVTPIADGLDPGVLRLVDAVCRGAAGRALVAVCGELAADETAVPLLCALGVRELSVAPAAIPAIKETVRAVDLGRASVAAAAALDAEDAAAVRGRP